MDCSCSHALPRQSRLPIHSAPGRNTSSVNAHNLAVQYFSQGERCLEDSIAGGSTSPVQCQPTANAPFEKLGPWGECLFFGAAFADAVSEWFGVLFQGRGAGPEPRAAIIDREHGEDPPLETGSRSAQASVKRR